MILIMLGAPGTGKGTVAEILSRRLNIPQISSGDIFRKAIAEKTPLGVEVEGYLAKGQLVPDELTIRVIEERLGQNDVKNGYILDGYPRNINQAIIYDNFLKENEIEEQVVIFLDIDKETAINRMKSRMICPKCGMSYNLSTEELSPVREGLCDNCSSVLTIRTDDTEETFKYRFDTYLKETYPLIEYYQNKNNLTKISVKDKTPNEIFEEVRKVIK